MGVATGLVNFTRQLGGVFGVAIGAALMLTTLTDRLTEAFPHAHIKAAELLSPQAAASFPAATQDIVRGAFADALHVVFVAVFVIVLLGAFTVLLMPRGSAAGDQGRRARRGPGDRCSRTVRRSSSAFHRSTPTPGRRRSRSWLAP